jgi:hypothetical protein
MLNIYNMQICKLKYLLILLCGSKESVGPHHRHIPQVEKK